jgi:hypothetical protein
VHSAHEAGERSLREAALAVEMGKQGPKVGPFEKGGPGTKASSGQGEAAVEAAVEAALEFSGWAYLFQVPWIMLPCTFQPALPIAERKSRNLRAKLRGDGHRRRKERVVHPEKRGIHERHGRKAMTGEVTA